MIYIWWALIAALILIKVTGYAAISWTLIIGLAAVPFVLWLIMMGLILYAAAVGSR